VWTLVGLVTYYVLFFIHLASRKVHIAGVTPHPDQRWMQQIARHVTMADWGMPSPGQYLIHDRDGKYCPAFQHLIDDAGVTRIPLPPRSPNLHAYAERWVRSVKEEALSHLILFGERSPWHALTEYVTHFHQERPHQGKDNVVLMPVSAQAQGTKHGGPIHCRERLGGLLKYYDNKAAWMVTLLDVTAGHHLYVARITGVEVIAAIRRRARRGDIAAPDVAVALAQFRQDFAELYHSIEITPALVARAMTLAETHALRGYDAVQLAAAVEVNTRGITLGLPVLTLVSADGELNVAATTEGVTVEDPNIH
jgi:predicted nucleic acid-binding protein